MDCEESELASNAKWVHEPSAEVIISFDFFNTITMLMKN